LVFSPKICPKTASFFIPAAAKPADWRVVALVRVGDVEKVLAAVMVKLLKACF
jgi:hypothetical protein